ncbi:efflux RND transporter periplasmic adaptor subunit [Schleiferia thermophila]|jgi:HlyD family secretion protein|uniref:HlyD family secretion protein n=1 Tax=Schleiferia thermophila TaxID=884107 RepID=A0A369A3P6_9FLAO|nr:efflux RND transporter periplasmic adaptor subunit [Schleiferia thermophila]KFD39650.1 RND transporter [Schleiferia thermophila str. Yellowstone]RCX03815.1 HlyD family secretion protein [Schleiferia thermophila]GCD80047.1 RND transporter [Schleiferia thermophila]
MKKKTVVILVAAAGIIALVALRKMGLLGSVEQTFEVETAVVDRGDIVETVTASGKVQPVTMVKISPEVPGEVIEVLVKEGQQVEKGQLLLKINPDIYLAAVKRAEAALNSAKANLLTSKATLAEAEKNYKRNLPLKTSGVISAGEFDVIERAFQVAKYQAEAAEYQLKSAEATYIEANDNLRRTTIYAPISGLVSKLSVEVGERVVGTAQMAGTEVMRIVDLSELEVVTEVNENDINKVKIGDSTLIEVDAVSDKPFWGQVTRVAYSSTTAITGQQISADQITNFEVRIRISPESYAELQKIVKHPFKPGMSASVEIFCEKVENAIRVPVRAVTVRSDSATAKTKVSSGSEDELFECVFLANGNRAVIRKVSIGIQDENFFEVKDGLKEGDLVISGPFEIVNQRLKNNSAIKIKSNKKK